MPSSFRRELFQSREEYYREGIFVGYRYYLSHPEFVRFPFGFGLSYTSFAYSHLALTLEQGTLLSVAFDLKNSGASLGR
jgi:beta-glucosidase